MFEMIGGPGNEDALMDLEHLLHSVDRFIDQPKRRRKSESQSDEKKS